MKLFFHPNPEEALALSEEESLHAIKVLRLKEGDALLILDGKGNKHEAIITKAGAKKCQFEITNTVYEQNTRPYSLHVAVSPTKNGERMEWWVEKAIEIGIDEISFLHCDHSERKNINLDRINKIAVSALKQSMNLYLPKINPIQNYSDFINQQKSTHKFIAHLGTGERMLLKNELANATEIVVLIGPEGDFSEKEIEAAIASNFKPVSLGESRLRTETAALAACFICHTIKCN